MDEFEFGSYMLSSECSNRESGLTPSHYLLLDLPPLLHPLIALLLRCNDIYDPKIIYIVALLVVIINFLCHNIYQKKACSYSIADCMEIFQNWVKRGVTGIYYRKDIYSV